MNTFLFNAAVVEMKSQGAKVNQIPIAMTTDNNYVYSTIVVAITSTLENKKGLKLAPKKFLKI